MSLGGVRFYVLHVGHEGSHGVGDKLVQMRCVNYLANEYFDIRESNGIANASQQLDALRTFFNMPLVTDLQLATVLPSMDKRRTAHADEEAKFFDAECSCEARGALLRADAATLCQLPGTKPYILVRTDLMRWSLSIYSEKYVQSMPQFSNVTLPKVAFRIQTLSTIARQLIQRWAAKANMYTNLIRCGLKPQLITFEAFEDTQQPPFEMVRQLRPCRHEQRPERAYTSVRVVHSHRISEFVENADQVHAHFIATPYPTFAQVFTQKANVTAAGFAGLVLA